MIIDWIPSAYSAKYRLEVDDTFNFRSLIAVFDPTGYRHPVQQIYSDFVKDTWPNSEMYHSLRKLNDLS